MDLVNGYLVEISPALNSKMKILLKHALKMNYSNSISISNFDHFR